MQKIRVRLMSTCAVHPYPTHSVASGCSRCKVLLPTQAMLCLHIAPAVLWQVEWQRCRLTGCLCTAHSSKPVRLNMCGTDLCGASSYYMFQRQVCVFQKLCACQSNSHWRPLLPAGVVGDGWGPDGRHVKASSEQQCTGRQSCCFVSNHQRYDGALHSNPQQIPELLNPLP